MRSTFSVFLCYIILCCIFVNCQSKETSVSKGKINLNISVNGVPVPFFNGVYLIFDGDYWLEEISMKQVKIDPLHRASDGGADKSKHYILTDVRRKEVTAFEYIEDSWEVVSRFPMKDKKSGFQFLPEIPQIAGYSNNFFYKGDTIIGNKTVKILVDTLPRPNPTGNKSGIVRKTIVYLETGRQNMPISISNNIDKKFGGWSYRTDMYIEVNKGDSRQKQSYSTEYEMNLTDEISEQHQILIDELKRHV
ncbi:hypothetical protein [Chitinophaga sp. XS-30]|uniref:hypothetical protein n=1 Tax=Chitinophaga sp. XS-30 TaxID=2604421 RepID=UPI0011DDF79B|nr:hypothetical protein [Chitinophaga sp. XS-30]QEH40734.1 hypothetical protein FW415_07535 [Chitinophaga sp. XS-30]